MTLRIDRLLDVPAFDRPRLLVVVDTEEEFDWHAPFDPRSTSIANIAEQPRAQAVLDRHGVAPTYVVDYPVAASEAARAVLLPIFRDRRCDIGAHLHSWVTPPHEGPVDARSSFPGNLPPALERRKLAALTEAITSGFGRAPTIYKAGRYGVGPATARILRELGYVCDVSVVPWTDFSGMEGPDFSGYGPAPFVSDMGLVAIPLSVGFVGRLARFGPRLLPALSGRAPRALHLPGIAARLGLLERLRLSPEGHTLADMVRQTRAALARGERVFMMTWHSSTLLPGVTDYVRDAAARDAFLARIDAYLRFFLDEIGGVPETVAGLARTLGAPPAADATRRAADVAAD